MDDIRTSANNLQSRAREFAEQAAAAAAAAAEALAVLLGAYGFTREPHSPRFLESADRSVTVATNPGGTRITWHVPEADHGLGIIDFPLGTTFGVIESTATALWHQGVTQGSRAVGRFLDLSTAHLPAPVAEDLNGFYGVTAHQLTCSDGAHGWLLWVPDDPDKHAADHEDTDYPENNIPAEVLAIQRYARQRGCDYILLDRDADRVADLPTWDW